MKIEHLAIWVNDLEKMKSFYMKYFGMTTTEIYTNAKKQYNAYFLSFEGEARLELMNRSDIGPTEGQRGLSKGLAHFAIAVGGKEKVDSMTELLRKDGYTIYGEPRTTGDGYYESVVLDPEGNYLELTS